MNLKSYTKSLWCCLLLLGLIGLQHQQVRAQATACTPIFSFGCTYDYISNVTTTGGSTNINQSSGCANGGYTDYSATQNHTGVAGTNINFSVTTDGDIEAIKIYVDWNNNGVLDDAGEVMYSSPIATTVPQTFTGSFAIPAATTPGPKRMRVRCNYYSTSITPCLSQTYGDAEDYRITVVAATPCSGTPTPGTITGPSPICPNLPFTLTLGGATTGGGIIYQWQSSPASANTWTNIGTNSLTYSSPGITAATDYRVQVTCSNSGGGTATTAVYTMNISPVTNCYCTPQYSTSNCQFGDYINTYTLTGANSTSFNQTNTGCSANGYANYTGLTPVQMYQGTNYNGTINTGYSSQNIRWWIDFNDDGIFQGTEGVSTLNGVGTTLVPYTIAIPPGANPGSHRMRVRDVYFSPAANSIDPCILYTYGETHDYQVIILALPPCTGTPVVATASATPNPVCPNIPFTLSVGATTTVAGGISYQWQDSFVGAPAFANVAGATTLSYTVSAGITATRYYRLRVICSNSSQTVYSNIVTVNVQSYLLCYCNNSSAIYTGDDDIGQVVVGSFSNPATAPSPLTNNPAAFQLYTNFTSLGPIQLQAGATNVPINITQFNSYSTWYSTWTKAFIDFNHNAILNDAGETVLSGGSTFGVPVSPTVTGTFNVPAAAAPGLALMRFVMVESASASTVNPCGTYNWGETEDYYVNVMGNPTLASNTPVCFGGTLVLTASYPTTPGATFTFSGPGITTTTNSTGVLNVPNVTNANGGTYSVTVSHNGGTSAPATTTVSIAPQQVISAGSPVAPTICGGSNGSLQITGLAPNTTYTFNYLKNSLAQTPVTVTSNASGTATITGLSAASYSNFIGSTAAGCQTTAAGPVTVPSPSVPPTPTGNYNPPLCIGSTLVLSVNNPTAGASYAWNGPNSYSANGASVTRSNLALNDSGDYFVTVTINNCVSNPGLVHVSINPPPPAPGVTNISYCQFETAVPLTAVGQNLKWYTGLTGGTQYPVAPTPTTLNAGIQAYYVSQTVNTCEGPRATILVTVKPKPPVPNTPSTTVEYCQFEITQPLVATGTNIQWYYTPTGGTSVTSITPTTTIPGTSTFYVTQTVNGCESDRLPIQVTVKPKPAPPVVASPLRLCQYDPQNPLTAIGQNLLWYTGPTGGVGDPIAPVPLTGNQDSFTYYVSQTVNGCESDRALFKVYVSYRPNGIISPSREFVCENDTLQFVYFGNALYPGAQYVWTVPNPAVNIVSGQGTPGPVVIQFNTPGAYTIKLVVNNNGCLSSDITRNMIVRTRPKLSFSVKPDVCIDEVVEVRLSSISQNPPIEKYDWTFDGGQVRAGSFGGGPYYVQYNTPGAKVITAVATGNGCSTLPAAADTVIVHDYARAEILTPLDNAKICSGDSLLFTAVEEPGVRYTWSPAPFFANSGSESGAKTWGVVKFGPVVRLKAENPWGCNSMDSVVLDVQPCCNMVFPTAFTPNADGRNDRFHSIGNGHPSIQNFRIINRWGQVVYENLNAEAGWDGTTNGVPQPMGTYFYFIRYKCSTGEFFEKKGDVLLVR